MIALSLTQCRLPFRAGVEQERDNQALALARPAGEDIAVPAGYLAELLGAVLLLDEIDRQSAAIIERQRNA